MTKLTRLFAATALSLAASSAGAASGTSAPISVEVSREGDLMRRAERFESPADAESHRADYAKFRAECAAGDFVIGQATSMEGVRPRAGFRWRRADEVTVRLARGERESVQLLVAPNGRDLRGVRVDVEGDLTPVEGQKITVEGRESTGFSTFQPSNLSTTLAAANVVASVVGYVLTTNAPNYQVRLDGESGKFGVPPTGWWPDPILDFQKECDIAGDDVQSFWVRVSCPRHQLPGIYAGALVVSAEGASPVRIPFTVRVNDFEVGRESPLPLAITCNTPGCNEIAMGYRTNLVNYLRNDPGSYHRAYLRHEREYTDFFADYFITRSSIYATETPGGEPYWDELVRLREEGRLGMFCLFYFRALPQQDDAEAVWRQRFMDVMRRRYDKAKALGLLDKAYFYGCDEFNPPTFTNVQAAAKILHEEFPGVPVMTTARDKQLGTGDSVLKDIDIHCPAVCFWDERPVAQAQAEGKKVWWYFCNIPTVPWANTMVDGSPAEVRSIMGAQARKFKTHGFLYYSTMKWNSEFPVTKGPFTDWTPTTGDGQWTCGGGPDNLPIPTIRLENFRDGLEDLWYVRRLEEAANEVEKLEVEKLKGDWLARARAALAVPDEVAKGVSDFSIDPAVIYRWRDEMADLIESAPCDTEAAPANPVEALLDGYVGGGRIAGVVSVLSENDYETRFDCSGWADMEKRIPMSPDTVFAVFSMTKTLTGAAIMAAIDEGKLSLDDEVAKYLPEFADMQVVPKNGNPPEALKRPLTIRDLMSHVTGSRCDVRIIKRSAPLREVARQMAARPLDAQPGETFAYGNIWVDAAAAALEVATGTPYEEWLREKILDPLEMRDTTFDPTPDQIRRLAKAYTSDDKGLRPTADGWERQLVFPWPEKTYPTAAAGLFTTPHDMARFSQMLAHHGEWKGRRILSRKNFDEIFAVKQTPPSIRQPYCVGAWLYGDWLGHEGAMRSDHRANLKSGQCRLFFMQTDNKAGPAFFELKRKWNALCDTLQGTPPFNPEN